ncbi:MAG: hypothetical protein Q9207_007555 [Kuettlingeria erythrocarpa]
MASHASFNITIDHNTTAPNSDRSSSITDGEGSSERSGVQVSHAASPSSVGGSHDYSDPLDETEESWGVVYPDEIGPSDSASRPRTANHHRHIVEAPQPEPARRQSARRQHPNEREHHHPDPRARRPHLPTSSGSVDSNEEWPYGRGPPQQYSRAYAHYGHASPAYAASYSSAQGYTQYPTANHVPPGQQLVPFASPPAPYNYPPYPGAAGGQAPGYFPPPQHGAPPMGHPAAAHPGVPYTGQEMIHHTPAPAFYPYAQPGYPVPPTMAPPAMYAPYPVVYSPPPTNTPPPTTESSSKDDEKFKRIEQLFLEQKEQQEAKEAAAIKAAQDAKAKAEADRKIADDIAAAAAAAAAAATSEAEKKAAEKAAELADEAAKAKAAAEEAEKKAAEVEAAAAAAAAGMEDLIRQAFLHVEVIGPHVAEGHYDLVGPNGEIILPQVWETMIEPDWVVTMHMWPMPEPPPPPPPPPAPPEGAADAVVEVPPADGAVPPPPPPPPPGAGPPKKKVVKQTGFLAWTAGKPKNAKSGKARRKPEEVAPVAPVQQVIV